jgi:hypothetical protein
MDDSDLLDAVREDFSQVRMNTEAEAILTAGGSLRRRRHRRLAYGTGASALATVAAVAAISGITLTSGPPATAHAELTAWTVQKEQNGTIDVTIHELRNLTGLQQKLNADGVRAEVVSTKRYPAACLDRAAMKKDMTSVITWSREEVAEYAFMIHPAGIPSGSKLLLDVTRNTRITGPGATGFLVPADERQLGLKANAEGWVSTGIGVAFGSLAQTGVPVNADMGLAYDRGSC